jgi:uncharacterized protein YxjI
MRYHLRERAWSLTNDFIIRNDRGDAVFEVKGKFFHIGDNLRLIDRRSGEELVHIKQRVISLLPCYDIEHNGQHVARVHEQIHLFGERFKVKGDDGMTFHVDGNLWNWDFSINDDYGNLLGQVNRQLSIFRDSYAVDVAQNVDPTFILSLAIVLEMIREHHRKEAHG